MLLYLMKTKTSHLPNEEVLPMNFWKPPWKETQCHMLREHRYGEAGQWIVELQWHHTPRGSAWLRRNRIQVSYSPGFVCLDWASLLCKWHVLKGIQLVSLTWWVLGQNTYCSAVLNFLSWDKQEELCWCQLLLHLCTILPTIVLSLTLH